jgi:hypothetical protein
MKKKHSKSSFDVLFGDTRRGDNYNLGIFIWGYASPKRLRTPELYYYFLTFSNTKLELKVGTEFSDGTTHSPPIFSKTKECKELMEFKTSLKIMKQKKTVHIKVF